MKHLNSDPHFLEAVKLNGCKTLKGAEQRIFLALGNANNGPLTFVMQVEDKFLPVAVLSDRTSGWLDALVRKNIYVTNA